MIKRTPQEIADFFQLYVVRQPNGCVWNGFSEKPKFHESCNTWLSVGKGTVLTINSGLIDSPENCDANWTHLYEPCVRNTCENEDENARITQEPSTNPASLCPHQSEVHTHREYAVIEAKRAHDLANKVNVMLAYGWEIQGGIAIEYLPESDDYEEGGEFFYQAMVRGV